MSQSSEKIGAIIVDDEELARSVVREFLESYPNIQVLAQCANGFEAVKVFVIPVEKLDYAEAQDDYVSLKSEGKTHLKHQTISGLEACLDPARFVRIHRSYLVNLDRVVNIEPYAKDSKIAILGDKTRLPVSRSGYARLQELLERGK